MITFTRMNCFMCSTSLYYSSKDFSKVLAHFKYRHNVSTGNSYLLAGCLMNAEEREAIQEVVSDKCGVSLNIKEPIEEPNVMKPENISSTSLSSLTSYSYGSVTIKKEAAPYEAPSQSKAITISSSSVYSKPMKVPIPRIERPNSNPLVNTNNSYRKIVVDNKIMNNRKSGKLIVDVNEEPGRGRICRVCNKEFKNRQTMKFHFENVHKIREFPCQDCGQMFTSKNNYTSHYSRQHRNKQTDSPLRLTHETDEEIVDVKVSKITLPLRMTQKAVEEDEDDPNSSRLEFDVEAFGEIGDPLKEPEHKTTKNLSENNTMRSFDEITLDEVGVDPLEEPDSSPSINTFQSNTQTKVVDMGTQEENGVDPLEESDSSPSNSTSDTNKTKLIDEETVDENRADPLEEADPLTSNCNPKISTDENSLEEGEIIEENGKDPLLEVESLSSSKKFFNDSDVEMSDDHGEDPLTEKLSSNSLPSAPSTDVDPLQSAENMIENEVSVDIDPLCS